MRRLHIGRAVRFLESTRVDVPTVIGWLKPVVLLPASALAGLTPQPDRSDPRARARPHPPSRLPRQSAADRRRNAAVLSPGGVVGVAPDPRRARELLRRSRGEPLRRSGGLRRGAGGARGAAVDNGRSRARGDRRLAAAAGQAAARRAVARRPRAGLARGRCRGARRDRACPRAPLRATRCTGEPQAPVAVPAAGRTGSTAAAGKSAPLSLPPLTRSCRPRRLLPCPPSVPVSAQIGHPRRTGTDRDDAHRSGPRGSARRAEPGLAGRSGSAGRPAVDSVVRSPPRPPCPSGARSRGARRLSRRRWSRRRPRPRALSPRRGRRTTARQSGNYVWSNNGQKLEVNYRGDIEFTADDTDVSAVESGRVPADQGRPPVRHRQLGRVQGRRATATIERRFWVGGRERPFDPEGRKWLAEVLPRFIRQSGIGATGAGRPDSQVGRRARRARRDLADRGQLGEARLLQRAVEASRA